MEINDLVLENLTLNRDFVKSVLPYIERNYFEDEYQRFVFDTIKNHIDNYDSLPTKESLLIDIENNNDLTENVYDEIVESITNWENLDNDNEWLIDSTEKWCQDRALYLALEESVEISSDEDTGVSRGKIPEILRDALSVSFDTSIGHDYFSDTENRFDFYNTVEEKIKFDIDWLNKVTDGGVPRKTLNLIMGVTGCVHPDTLVKIRYYKDVE